MRIYIVYQAIVISANSIFLIAFLSVLDLRSFIRTLIFLFILVFVLDRIFIFELITHFFIHGTTKQLRQRVGISPALIVGLIHSLCPRRSAGYRRSFLLGSLTH